MAGRFDKSAFVERIKGLNIHVMIEAARSEIFDTESRYHGVRGDPQARDEGSMRYVVFLKGIVYYLEHGQRPGALTGDEFHLLRPLVDSLVERGQLKASALDDFIG